GLGISNRVGRGFSTGWTVGYAADSGAFCGNVRSAAAVAAVRIINAGPTPFSPNMGFLVWPRPMLWPVNPLGGNTIFQKTGCGRTASPVRREGRPLVFPTPIPIVYSRVASRNEETESRYPPVNHQSQLIA